MPTPSRRLLVFQETRNPQNMSELVYIPVNRQGLPICGSGPELPSILELPLRIVKAFTDIFNHPRYRGWWVHFFILPGVVFLDMHYAVVLLTLMTGQSYPQVDTMTLLKKGSSMLLYWSRFSLFNRCKLGQCPQVQGKLLLARRWWPRNRCEYYLFVAVLQLFFFPLKPFLSGISHDCCAGHVCMLHD